MGTGYEHNECASTALGCSREHTRVPVLRVCGLEIRGDTGRCGSVAPFLYDAGTDVPTERTSRPTISSGISRMHEARVAVSTYGGSTPESGREYGIACIA